MISNKSSYEEKEFDLLEFNETITMTSGAGLYFKVVVKDLKGNILTFDNKSTCSFENINLPSENLTSIVNNIIQVKMGVFTFDNLILRNNPDSNTQLKMRIIIPKGLILNEETYVLLHSINFYFRPCGIGEIILPDLTCFKCKENSFSKIDPMFNFSRALVLGNPQRCEQCSEKAICLGGNQIFPRPGFWRYDSNSESFQECFIKEACEGPGDYSEANRAGKCNIGHFGNLCHDCLPDYGKLNANFLCQPCVETNPSAIIRLIFAIIFFFIYTVATSYKYSIQDSGVTKSDYIFIYMKINLNLTQIVGLITFIKFNWVISPMKRFFSVSSNVISLATDDVLLNDCIIQNSITGADGLYAFKLIVISLLPFFLSVMTSIFWFIFFIISILIKGYKSKKLQEQIKSEKKLLFIRLIASFLIAIFLFNPLIIKYSFSMLNCFNIEIENPQYGEYMYSSPSFKCWTSFHSNLVNFIAIPGIIIWGVVFPIMLLIVLVHQKNIKKSKKIYSIQQDSSMQVIRFEPNSSTGLKENTTRIQINSGPMESPIRLKSRYINSHTGISEIYEVPANPDVSFNKDYSINKDISLNHEEKGLKISKKKSIIRIVMKSNLFKFLYYG